MIKQLVYIWEHDSSGSLDGAFYEDIYAPCGIHTATVGAVQYSSWLLCKLLLLVYRYRSGSSGAWTNTTPLLLSTYTRRSWVRDAMGGCDCLC